jgi:hypothetical protein
LRLDTATVEDFAPLVGERFTLDAGEAGTFELELIAATPARNPGPEGTRHPFTVEFLGPADPVAAQQTVRLNNERLGELEIFIVPVGRDDSGTAYEAVFS